MRALYNAGLPQVMVVSKPVLANCTVAFVNFRFGRSACQLTLTFFFCNCRRCQDTFCGQGCVISIMLCSRGG